MADWSDAPTVLVFGDTEAGRAMAVASATDSGARVAASLPIEQAPERLDSQIAVDVVIVDLTIDHGTGLDQLLRRIEDAARARQFISILLIAPSLIDIAASVISHDDIDLQVGRDPHTLGRALARAFERGQPQLREPPENGEAARLQYLTEAAERHGRVMAASLDGDNGSAASGIASAEDPEETVGGTEMTDAAAIRSIIRSRRLRAHFFGSGLFADPAWDILLDLTAARIEGRSVAVSSLCIAAAVPATTALRWIKQLTDMGFLRRVADPVDGRRVFIELTEPPPDR
ncbi:winged helix DNA-binding protein [Sphingomonas sp. SRS2]|uniref:winged helix DNA-binding protein n=1 Tax=Sphingomonas sp. SRS2 TaxID=133190 RepID=UPI000A0489BC|nr:winged helix DNA-binding protein [Sphingomonas sp. SRS2]